jgi:ACR3 family arsenite efflux pump ArsB
MTFLRFSSVVKKRIMFVIPSLLAVGLVSGYFLDLGFLKPLSRPLSLLIVYPLMIGLPTSSLTKWGDSRVLGYALVMNFAVVPLLGYGVSSLFFERGSSMFLGLLLISLLPTSGGMTVTWTGLEDGNVVAAAKMTIIGLMLGALTAPFYIQFFVGQSLDVQLMDIVWQVIYIIVTPFVAGQATRIFYVKARSEDGFNEDLKPYLSILFMWGILALTFVSVALKAKLITGNLETILGVIAPLLVFYTAGFLLSGLVAKLFLNRSDGVAFVYGTALRSLGVALALSLNIFKGNVELAVLVALANLIQMQFATWSKKLIEILYPSSDMSSNPLTCTDADGDDLR